MGKKINFYSEGGQFLHHVFAEWFVKESNAVIIDGTLRIFKDGIYVEGQSYIEAAMVKYIPSLTRNKRAEVFSDIQMMVLNGDIKKVNSAEYRNYIAFKNGVYDIENKKIIPFNKDLYITNIIPWNYDPKAQSEDINKIVKRITCNDKELQMLICEMIGYCFYSSNYMNKAFVLIGNTHNGKSTFQNMLKLLFGEKNISTLDMKDLSDKFRPFSLVGKMVNIGDDISDSFIDDSASFKSLVSGMPVTVEQKNKDPFTFMNRAKFILSTNNMPKTHDATGAVLSRLIIIPFNRTFKETDDDFDPEIGDRILCGSSSSSVGNNMSALINYGIWGLEQIRKNKKFTESNKVNKALSDYDKENNPIKIFFDEYIEDNGGLDGIAREFLYDKYCIWCDLGNQKKMSQIIFSRFVCAEFGMEIKVKYNSELQKAARTFVKKEN